MEEKKEIKISLTTLFLIIAIILIVIMGIYIFNLYKANQKSESSINELNAKISTLENSITEQKDTNIVQDLKTTNEQLASATTNKNKTENLDVNNSLVKKLYGYVLKSDDFDHEFAWQNGLEPASFYKSTKTTFSTLSNMEKMLIVLKNYSSEEVKTVNKTQVKDMVDISEIHDTVQIYENFNKKAKEIFNENNYDWKDYIGCAGRLEYKNDNYYLFGFDGGGKGSSIGSYSKLQKAEKNQDYIYLYDKFIYVDFENLDMLEGDQKAHVYTEADEKNDIGTESDYPSKVEELYKKYENKLKTYKHTFKQNEDGSYYWVSSEIYE